MDPALPLLLLTVPAYILAAAAQAALELSRGRADGSPRAEYQALAAADVMVLAAWYDHRITDAERVQLAEEMCRAFAKLDVTTNVDELIERWEGFRSLLDSDDDVRDCVALLAKGVEPSHKRALFEAVSRLFSLPEPRPEGGPYRSDFPSSRSNPLAVFGEALGISAEEIREKTSPSEDGG